MFKQTDKVDYNDLNSRQKENYNYQRLSGVLADYGFVTHRLSDDWQGADFIAQHINRDGFLKVQLKGRMTFDKKYQGKEIWIAFNERSTWYIYPHDEVLAALLSDSKVGTSVSWAENGGYSFPYLSAKALLLLEPYRLA